MPLSIQNVRPRSASLEISRSLAASLAPGRHELSLSRLERAYGHAPMTASDRTRVASELDYVGLVILSEPWNEPLVVAKPPDSGSFARAVRARTD